MVFIGKKCPFCENTIEENEDVVICSKCKTPHHKACWVANHGCTTYSCDGEIRIPQDFEEPVFYKPVDIESDSAKEINKADGSQYSDYFGGNKDSQNTFQGVKLNSSISPNSASKGENKSLPKIFAQKTEDDIRTELKEEIKEEIRTEIKAKPMTALVCERCGASLSIEYNKGKIVCPSCLTEYIMNNNGSSGKTNQIQYDNPFGYKSVDPKLFGIKEYMDSTKEYAQAFIRLESMEEEFSAINGYWILRLRAYTEDFNKNIDDYKSFNEIYKCLKEHQKYFYFEDEDIKYLDGYFAGDHFRLEAQLQSIKSHWDNIEEELISHRTEEKKMDEEIHELYYIMCHPRALRKKTKKEKPMLYLGFTLCIIATVLLGILVVVLGITIILIPLALLCLLLQITAGVFIFVLRKKKIAEEDDFMAKTMERIDELEHKIAEEDEVFQKLREKCVKDFYAYKCTNRFVSFRMCDLDAVK